MADITYIRRWNNTTGATALTSTGGTSGWVTFKDEDLGNPLVFKRWYGLRLTYKIMGTMAKTSAIAISTDGSSLGTSGVPTGNLNKTSTSVWMKDDVQFTTIKSVASAKVKVNMDASTGIYEINDIGLELRPIYRRVT